MKHARLLAVALAGMAVVGCATSAPKQPVEPEILPSFDFEPPTRTALDSASVSFCLVKPQFPEMWQKDLNAYYPFNKFSQNMASDFEEILSARGFRMRGPFGSYDEMAFPDKSQSDLALMPKIEFDFSPVGVQEAGKDLLGTPWYRWKGTIKLGGRVIMAVNETLSNERMWSKSVELPARSFAYQSPKYAQPMQGLSLDDVKLANLLAKQMQDYYAMTMTEVWKYLDPQEMAMIKKQAVPLKDKVRYGG